jgi:small conductance mechanosensitive channel
MSDELANIDQIRTTLIDLGLRFGPRVLAALIILTIGFFVGRAIATWVERGLRHIDREPPVRLLLVRIARLLVMLLFTIMALQNLGVELLPLVAGLGIAGAGIALAMQGLLGNLFAGLSIIFSKPFRVGEYISVVGEEGRVEAITLFSTTLSHADRSAVIIPNRKIVGEILHNYGKIRQVAIVATVAHDTDVAAALAVVRGILDENPRVLKDPVPNLGAGQLTPNGIDLSVGPWVAVPDLSSATSELNQAIVAAFRSKGIQLARPYRDIKLIDVKASSLQSAG